MPNKNPNILKSYSTTSSFYSNMVEKIKWFNFYDGKNGIYGIAYVEKGFNAQLHFHNEPEYYYFLYGKGKVYINGKIRIIDVNDGKITIPSNAIHAMTPCTNFVILMYVFHCQTPFHQIKYCWLTNYLTIK